MGDVASFHHFNSETTGRGGVWRIGKILRPAREFARFSGAEKVLLVCPDATDECVDDVGDAPIVLQKPKAAGPRMFRKSRKQSPMREADVKIAARRVNGYGLLLTISSLKRVAR